MYYLKNTNFWMFGLFFFFYFFIMGAYFPFFPIWLHDINHISKSDTGIIFAAISLFSLLFQPLFGLLSDKLGLRKYLLWIITGMLVMFAPFFIFIFGPLLQYNILVGSIVASQAIGDKWLVTEGLKAGDRVVISGLQKVRPGVQVKAQEVTADNNQQAASGAQPEQSKS